MNRNAQLQALSQFLKAQRAKITPESVNLPSGPRRRTPGLRREEVAQLAGVSPTWYTWLEQGRDISVSASVLDAVAAALRLTVDERKYMYALATETGSGTGSAGVLPDEEMLEISQPLRKILQELRFSPAIVSDRKCRIIGWNEAAAHVFLDFEQIPPEERSMIELLFTRKELRKLALNWEDFVSGYLAIFRSYYGQYVGDDWYDRFIEEMKSEHEDFKSLWEASAVSSAPEVLLEFRHAKAGKMQFHLTSFQVQGNSDIRCSIYTPAPESATESKLRRLMER
ncbi:helix-turn-helix transcriptional regulator [Paenibacillus sp. HB172176]|uniref:helix-turn-helix transcriptional regulator n=1 Tax=Paenibacillus sp. HB172176 TaxID=2493690 RepID=UPI00143AF750|nr:helix-turn-helix transcriptional regulator [Paenibacillus sp. HB172176]